MPPGDSDFLGKLFPIRPVSCIVGVWAAGWCPRGRVPPVENGSESLYRTFPALKRWAMICRPSAAGF